MLRKNKIKLIKGVTCLTLLLSLLHILVYILDPKRFHWILGWDIAMLTVIVTEILLVASYKYINDSFNE